MPFEVIPAIDVAGGRLALFTSRGAVAVDAFGGDPIAAARAFVGAGAARLHVVDVDLALTGEPRNLRVLREVAALEVPVQASGGIVSASHVEAALEAGADRVVLGSGALGDRAAVEALVAVRGESLAVAVEASGDLIVPRGREVVELPLWHTVEWLTTLDVRRFVFTEVGRSGALGGPDLDGIRALASRTGRPVIASGGIRGVEDVVAVAALGGTVEGAIVGRALYEGLALRDVLRAAG